MEYWSKHSRPTLITWKPSTSLSGETALQIFLSSMCSERDQTSGLSLLHSYSDLTPAYLVCCANLFFLQLASTCLNDLLLPSAQKEHIKQGQMPVSKPMSSCMTASLHCSWYQDLIVKSGSNWYSDVGEENLFYFLSF